MALALLSTSVGAQVTSKVPLPSVAPAGGGAGVVPAAARARLLLERDTVSEAGHFAVRVKVVGQGFTVASYQGTLRFSTAGGQLVRWTGAPAVEGQNLLNPDEKSAGLVRYAGFSARGFPQGTVEVGRMVFRAASLEKLKLTGTLDVVGDPDGKSVPVKQRAHATGVTAAR